MSAAAPGSSADVVAAYHARAKHDFERFARGPETLDWDAQPNPFRPFAGRARIAPEVSAHRLNADFAEAREPGEVAPVPLNAASVGALLELSVGLTAWKDMGPDRRAPRGNSGNPHPTEAHVHARGVAGLGDGRRHCVSRDHGLECRRRDASIADAPAMLWIGLSSVHWPEAWKYGERAFRHSQLDTGHALGGFRYAAGALGWTATPVEDVLTSAPGELMGLDRAEDFGGVEPFAPSARPIPFVHRVEGLEPGLYAPPRRAGAAEALKATGEFEWLPCERFRLTFRGFVSRRSIAAPSRAS